ncbi:hypothetical protein, unlikely [Trypanosoma brucei gambiense DAL972]|uniref:Uncharacterized protein n=1 Tax=Trypanosoma brucei gambiense (strain MHOM/CI/86/DAL972) TaxID=679716 RepID=D0A5D4_TRYB9|nr:hypothetical protein, unlikely [Trypanosoma brucei gambiense DAL972]CBH16478.1 hypothetical protein, unlikely [Trypanosoma brucei gambiense DAL972]|eukprot:XP_011778742.1 hypothetical protein, unlikely [Trypanosoma brucei gambiense DAL972]
MVGAGVWTRLLKEARGKVCRKEWISQRRKGYTLVPKKRAPFREQKGTKWMCSVHSLRGLPFVEISGVLVGIADTYGTFQLLISPSLRQLPPTVLTVGPVETPTPTLGTPV